VTAIRAGRPIGAGVLAGLLAAGALAAHSLAAIGRVAGIAGLAASAAAAAALLAARGRLDLRAIARRPQARLAGLLLAAVLAAWVCGAMLQDTTAREETVHLNPRVAGLLASHVPPDATSGAVSLSHLVQPPGLWFMAVVAVAFLDVRRRGRSTIRIAAATAASLAIAGVLDTTLPGWDRHTPVSLGAAAIAALAVSTVFFAARWLDLIRAGIAAGKHDTWLKKQAAAVGAWGKPIYLSFHHEPEVWPQCGSPATLPGTTDQGRAALTAATQRTQGKHSIVMSSWKVLSLVHWRFSFRLTGAEGYTSADRLLRLYRRASVLAVAPKRYGVAGFWIR